MAGTNSAFINAQIAPKRLADSLMLTEFLIFLSEVRLLKILYCVPGITTHVDGSTPRWYKERRSIRAFGVLQKKKFIKMKQTPVKIV